MGKIPSRKGKMQVFIITCYLFGSVFSASLFGDDFPAPKKVIRTGVDEISQVVRPNNRQQPDSPVAPNNQSNNKKNSYNSRNRNSVRSILPAEIAEMFKPQEPPKSINKPTLERNQTTNSIKHGGPGFSSSKPASSGSKNASVPLNLTEEFPPIPVKDGGATSSSSKNTFVPLNPTEETQTGDAFDQAESFFTIGWSDNGIEFYTTETSEYETTTDEPLNRIGGLPPAIVASILGGG